MASSCGFVYLAFVDNFHNSPDQYLKLKIRSLTEGLTIEETAKPSLCKSKGITNLYKLKKTATALPGKSLGDSFEGHDPQVENR